MKKAIQTLQEYSIPLLLGVVLAMIMANVDVSTYRWLVDTPIPSLLASSAHADADHAGWEHFLTLHFLANELLMVFFFGIAAKEITEACLPNGALNPPRKAINPLMATIGGVLGPVAVFYLLNSVFGDPTWARGWGIPTATDIALAWLAARLIFGASHPAVTFLLLLAVADDAIGLGIIAFGYPNPLHPIQGSQLLWIVPGVGVAWYLRRRRCQTWIPYILLGGSLCWFGLFSAHLHPALALVPIVPFLPGPKRDMGLFTEDSDHAHSSPLERFEHHMKGVVDFGLFFFAFANAGVPLSEVNGLTWILFASLIVGKMIGIVGFSLLGTHLGFPLPKGMDRRHLVITAVIAGLGLTVALFVSTQAFADVQLQGAAKMGAVLSATAAILGWLIAELTGVTNAYAALRLLVTTPQAGTESVEPAQR